MGLFKEKVKQHLTLKYKFDWGYAILKGDLRTVKELSSKIDINTIVTPNGETGIKLALRKGNYDIVKFLRELPGIKIDEKDSFNILLWSSKDFFGES